MLAIVPENVTDAIITVFSSERELRADALYRRINTNYFKCSERAVYKELQKLLRLGVAVKIKDHYSLSITWILNLIRFSESLYNVSVGSPPQISKLPKEGERLSWHFHDLQHLDRFWIQMMFLLFEHSASRVMFAWVPHFWFDLVHYEKDLEAQSAMKIAKNKMYMLLGGRTFLDRLPTKYWSRDVYEWSYAVSPFESQRTQYFDVIDNYILTIKLDTGTARRIGALFDRVKSKADLGLTQEFEAIKTSGRATMVLECSEKKAKRLRRQCADFFGIPDPLH